MMNLPKPYMLFLGSSDSKDNAKTATGVFNFCPTDCLAEAAMPNSEITFGLPKISYIEAKDKGIKSLIIGVANAGGYIDKEWIPEIKKAIIAGLNIISGLHEKLNDHQELVDLAKQHNIQLIDVRKHDPALKVASGKQRSGKRILTVGTDCNIGKMFTALKVCEELKKRNINADFRATGQTGIMIAGSGIAVDAVISDFISGAVESISPSNEDDHYDVIEGQGSIFHPSYSGVSLGLLHGAMPDYLILCHEPTRIHMRHTETPMPDLKQAISLHLELAKLMNEKVKFLGVALNLSKITDKEKQQKIREDVANITGLVAVDPNLDGVSALIDNI